LAKGCAVNVTVRFFASLREAVGLEAVTVQPKAPTLCGVRRALTECLDAAQWEAVAATGVQVALNQTIVQDETALADGDEVAFLPPVTGG
jgi:molybdopterin synthase sulfur carrier subunit